MSKTVDPFHPYADRYEDSKGPGDGRPTALEIVEDNGLVGKWAGKVAIVTGGSSAIGVETVRALHATDADVYFTARDAQKGQATKQDIAKTSSGKGRLEVLDMDMDSLESVWQAAKTFLSKSSTLNVLVNNAGIMAPPYSKTVDGFERQFAVNHLAHYLFTRLLLPALVAGSSRQLNSRVVFVSSSSHRYSKIFWDNYSYERPGSYDAYQAYGQSKMGNVWTANYIDRVFGPQGVHALSLHPGGIWTGLQGSADADMVAKWKKEPEVMSTMLSPAQGAATSIWAAVATVWEGKEGEYLAECGVSGPAKSMTSTMESGSAPWIHELESEDRLWELSAKLVGVEESS